MQELFGNTFANILRIDFLENPTYKKAFEGALPPEELLMNIELLTNQIFNPKTDLLILDEIGECEHAVTSLKYFAEKAPSYFVAASGSNIGLLNTFIKAFDNQTNTPAVHSKLMDKLTDYFFTGGMPKAVAS